MLSDYIKVDNIAAIMTVFISIVTLIVSAFAFKYMNGDRNKYRFHITLLSLWVTVVTLVCADNIFLFLVSWAASNFLLVQLMQHNRKWIAAKNSASLAFKNFSAGFICISLAFAILYLATNETSIQAILHSDIHNNFVIVALLLIVIAAMSQSALWPFHKWLLSSLNSPTPVSAIMHAGLINGGGFLLARFAPLLLELPLLLNLIIIAGLISALLGNTWKLLQNDIKRMLACSTMAQMGFMIIQCGLGLYGAAITHLCLHGFFKSYLFLASGSAAKDNNIQAIVKPELKSLIEASAYGILSAYLFANLTNKLPIKYDTNLIIIIMSYLACTQISLSIITAKISVRRIIALTAAIIVGVSYAVSVNFFVNRLSNINQPQEINFIHILMMVSLILPWLILNVRTKFNHKLTKVLSRYYVYFLNASQPHHSTITSHRNQYQY